MLGGLVQCFLTFFDTRDRLATYLNCVREIHGPAVEKHWFNLCRILGVIVRQIGSILGVATPCSTFESWRFCTKVELLGGIRKGRKSRRISGNRGSLIAIRVSSSIDFKDHFAPRKEK